MPIKNDFEHGVVDATVTTGNSGDVGMGNTAANLVQVTAGHSMIYDDDWAAHGARSVKIVTNTTAGTYLRFTPDAGDRQVATVYFRIPSYPTGGSFPIVTLTGTSSGCKIVVGTTGTISAQNASGTGIAPSVSTYTLATNTTARLDVECVKGTTTSNGTISYRLWVGANLEGTTTPDAEWTSGATVNTGVNQATQIFVGKGTSASTAASVSIDDFRSQALGSGWIAPVGADVVGPGLLGRVAIIGDSQLDQFPTGVGTGRELLRTAFIARGWKGLDNVDWWFHGVGGKTLTTADSTGTTTLQDITNARAAFGAEPDLWVINLGGNSSGVSEATFRAGVSGILDAIGDTHRILWFGIQGNPNTTARANATGWLQSEVEARPLGQYVDTQAWIHDGRDETGIWQGDAIHMTPTGYDVRNPWVADRANRTRTEDMGFTATSETAAIGGGGPDASGGAVSGVSTTAVGSGAKGVAGGGIPGSTTTPVGSGTKHAAGGSIASVATTAVGSGDGTGSGAGGAVASVQTTPLGAGTKHASGGGLASVVSSAVSEVTKGGAGGAVADVEVDALAAGLKAAAGGSIASVTVSAVGGGGTGEAIMSNSLVTVARLAQLLRISIASDDPYALMIVEQASNAVRDAARHPEWVLSNPQPGEVIAPQTAQDIALWVARRAYTHPGNLSRRTAGPISESYFENGVEALELTESELKRLNFLVGSTRGGLWVQPINSGYRGRYPLTVPSDMDPPGDSFVIADSDHFPYAGYPYDTPPPVVGDVNYVP